MKMVKKNLLQVTSAEKGLQSLVYNVYTFFRMRHFLIRLGNVVKKQKNEQNPLFCITFD